MASFPKAVEDLKGCIQALKTEHHEGHITDNSTELHKFCVKLEYVLQIDMKARVGMWGGKKDYWDFFCASLGKIKGLNDGIRFVKGMKEVKTSLGRGRAFIRYSLVHHRLGDTLQQCASNGEITRQWYSESSILCQPSAFAALTNDLYDLNDIQFDLAPSGHELDTAWPTFARSAIGVGLYLWNPPTRSSSMASINSTPSQADGRGLESMTEVDSAILDNQLEKLTRELEGCEKYNRDLRRQLQTVQSDLDENRSLALENEARLSGEISELQRKNQELVFKSDQAVSGMESARQAEEAAKRELESASKEHQRITGEFGERLETLKLQLSSETAMRQKHESEQRTECLALQKKIGELEVQLQGREMEQGNLREVEARLRANLEEAEAKNKGLEQRINKLTNTIESNLMTRSEQLSQEFQSITLLRSLFAHLSNVRSDNRELNNVKTEFYSKLEALLGVDSVERSSSGDVDVSLLDGALSRLEEDITKTQQGLQEAKVDVNKIQASSRPMLGEREKTADALEYEKKIRSLEDEIEKWKLTSEQQRNLVLDRDLRLKEKTNQLNHTVSEMKLVTESTNTILETSRHMIGTLPESSPHSKLPNFYSLNSYGDSSVPCAEVLRTLPDFMEEVGGRIGNILLKREEIEKDLTRERGTRENLQGKLDASLITREEVMEELKSLQESFDQVQVSQTEKQTKLQCLEEELCSIRADIVCKEEEIESVKNSGEKLQNDFLAEIQGLRASLKESDEKVKQLKLECLNSEEEVKSLNLKNERLEEEKLSESQEKADIEEQKVKLEEELNLKSSQIKEIEAVVVKPRDESGDKEGDVVEMSAKTVTEVMQEHEDKVEFMTEQFKLLKTDLESVTVEKGELTKRAENLERERVAARIEFETTKSERDELEKRYEALSEEHRVLKVNNDSVSSQFILIKSELRGTKEESKTDKDKMQENGETIKKLDAALDCARETAKEHQDMFGEKQEQLVAAQKELEELGGKLEATENECENAKDVMEREVSAIEFQRSTEAMQYQVKLESFDALNNEVSQWRDRCLELEENLGNVTEELEQAKEQQVDVANKHQTMMKESEDQCAKYQQDAQVLESSLVQISDQLEQKTKRLVDLEEKVKSMQENGENQLDFLKEQLDQKEKDNEELMTQIVKFGKDKNVLWQRLQKLETQRKSKAMERWIDDKNATQCMECEAPFSLTVRKHHCRVCGGVYCSSCTDYSILTAQSKKRVRVCEKCFVLHNHSLEAMGADTSLVVDDSPEETVAAFKESRLSLTPSPQSEPTTSSPTLETDEHEQKGTSNEEMVTPTQTDEVDISTGENKAVDAKTTKISSSDGDGDFELITDEDVTEARQEQEPVEAPPPPEKPEHTRYDPITSQEIQVTEGTQRELHLSAGTAHLVPIIIEEEGVLLCWEFTSAPKSIAVKVSFAESLEDEVKEEIVPLRRFNSHHQSASGELLTYKSGVYIIQFDNTFSRMTPKTVTYQLSIKQPDISY